MELLSQASQALTVEHIHSSKLSLLLSIVLGTMLTQNGDGFVDLFG
jgi:hypothetical protein